MRITLRPYQADALARIDAEEADGNRRLLGVAATGLGKTVIFAALAEQRGCRTLILAHRDELVRQAIGKVREVWPDCPSIGMVKGPANDINAHVVVASVQTLSRPRRLASLGAAHGEPDALGAGALFGAEPFGLVIVDEAHHAAADTYRAILNHLGAGRPDGPLLLGVTATPDRGDGVGLEHVFATIAFSHDIMWGIREGYLADLRGLAVEIEGLDLDRVRVTRGDYTAGDSGRALMGADAPGQIARAWAEHARDRRSLVFTPTVQTAVATAEAMRDAGARTASISGELELPERRSILRAFEAGDLDAVVNCMVLTEGYDAPHVDCVIVARPTQSRSLYTQMIGRGTRLHPDKTDCLVIDVVGAARQHSLVTIPSLFGLPLSKLRRQDGSPQLVSTAMAEHQQAEVAAGRLRAEEVELFRQVRSQMAWVRTHRDGDDRRRYTLALGRGRRLVLAQLDPGDDHSWGIQLQVDPPDRGPLQVRTLLRDAGMETCQAVGEEYARAHGRANLTDPDAAWRSRPPRPRQLHAARRWHLKDLESYRTAGELSDALEAHISRIRARKAAKAKTPSG